MSNDFAKQDTSFSEGLSAEATVLQHHWQHIVVLLLSLILTISIWLP